MRIGGEGENLRKTHSCKCGTLTEGGLKLHVMLPGEILNVFEKPPRGICWSESRREWSLNFAEEPKIRLQYKSWIHEVGFCERRILQQVVQQSAYRQLSLAMGSLMDRGRNSAFLKIRH